MGTLKDKFSKTFGLSKSPFDSELCKYDDLEKKSIIHQGHLQYLYHTTILGDSQFRTYLVVLTRISFEKMEDAIGLYLFADEKKSATYLFLIDQKTNISDRCDRSIKPLPRWFLMELKFIDKDKVEIFGAKDNLERQKWVEIIKNLFIKSKLRTLESDSTYLLPTDLDESLDSSSSVINHAEFPFGTIESEEDSSYSKVEPTPLVNRTETNRSATVELTTKNELIWNDIFYSNINDDFKSVLVKTGEHGAFLIRPQSKKTSSNDHDYTLCVYNELNTIRCFGIYQLPKRGNEYSLAKQEGRSFVDMVSLCRYYSSNPLPTSTKTLYLKKSYKFY